MFWKQPSLMYMFQFTVSATTRTAVATTTTVTSQLMRALLWPSIFLWFWHIQQRLLEEQVSLFLAVSLLLCIFSPSQNILHRHTEPQETSMCQRPVIRKQTVLGPLTHIAQQPTRKMPGMPDGQFILGHYRRINYYQLEQPVQSDHIYSKILFYKIKSVPSLCSWK